MATLHDFSRGVTKEVRAASTIVANDPVRVGDLVGVAMTNALLKEDTNYYVTVAFEGVLSNVGTANGLSSAAINQGVPIYTATAAGANNVATKIVFTTTASTNKLFGYTLNTRASNTGNLEIKVVN
jgi:predicted RecA/RadA family phage recombinase